MTTVTQDPIASLKQDHVRILGYLEELRQGVSRLGSGTTPQAAASLRKTVETLAREIDRHSLKMEEQALFPSLEEAIGPMGPIAVMLADHREIDSRLPRLLEEAKKERPDVALIRNLAGFLLDILPPHIQKEDFILYPMAQRGLSREQMDRVRAKMKELEQR